MPEKREVNTNCDFCKTPEQLRQQLSGMSEPEIMQMLSDWTECAHRSGEELPPELVMTFYDVLDEVAPLEPMPFDFQASWKRFTKEHPELIPQEKGADTEKKRWARPRKLKYLLSAAVVAALCIGAYANDMPSVVYLWGQDVLQITSTSGEMEFERPNNEGYTSFHDALQAHGMNVDLPTWLPERFHLEDISINLNPEIDYFTAEYISSAKDERPIFIHILYCKSDNDFPTISYEKDVNGDYQKYFINGNEIYVFTNEGLVHINWIDYRCSVDISGPLSKKELKQILHSIGKD
ncbi:DUF4367 domain-containing protein [Butyricicoccus sp. 1XD8-22]|nr:DUF4367 domain-containing protein [Butyricicoccus sp. 1XD8-22]